MAGSSITGFTPATSAAGKAIAGLATVAAAGEGDLPLRDFGALVDLVAAAVPGPAEFSEATAATPAIAAPGIAAAPVPLEVEFALAPAAVPELDGEQLLGDLVDALAQLEQALADGEPVDPDLAGRVADAMDALAGMLGIPLPAAPEAPVVPPAAGLAAPDTAGLVAPPAPLPTGEIDALRALASEAAPRLLSASTLAPAPLGEGPAPAMVFTAPAIAAAPPANPANTAPAVAAPAAPAVEPAPAAAAELAPAPATPTASAVAAPTAPAVPAAEAPPAINPASPLGKLVERIAELARTLEPQAPGLAKRLDALVEKLGSGAVGAPLLAELGLDDTLALGEEELGQAIKRFLGTSPIARGTPAPQAYAPVQLAVP